MRETVDPSSLVRGQTYARRNTKWMASVGARETPARHVERAESDRRNLHGKKHKRRHTRLTGMSTKMSERLKYELIFVGSLRVREASAVVEI